MQTQVEKSKGTNGKGAGRISAITGIMVSKIDAAHVKKIADEIGVEYADGADGEAISVALDAHFKENSKGLQFAACNICNGTSPASLSDCPYCGIGGEISPEAEASPPAETRVSDSTDITPPAEIMAEITVPATGKKGKKKKDGETAPAPATTVPESRAMVHVQKAKPLAKNDQTEDLLDAKVKEVLECKAEGKRLNGDMAVAVFKLGHAIGDIYDLGLWKLRKGEAEGQGRYKSFDAFANAELGITPQYAHSIRKAMKKHTIEEVREFGATKLIALMRAPEAARPAIRKLMEGGASKAQMSAEIAKANKQLRKEQGDAGKLRVSEEKGTVTPVTIKTAKAKVGADQRVSVAAIEGKHTIKLFCKPPRMKGTTVDDKGDVLYNGTLVKRAKKLADSPWGRWRLANGTHVNMAILPNGTGELVVMLDVVREEEG